MRDITHGLTPSSVIKKRFKEKPNANIDSYISWAKKEIREYEKFINSLEEMKRKAEMVDIQKMWAKENTL